MTPSACRRRASSRAFLEASSSDRYIFFIDSPPLCTDSSQARARVCLVKDAADAEMGLQPSKKSRSTTDHRTKDRSNHPTTKHHNDHIIPGARRVPARSRHGSIQLRAPSSTASARPGTGADAAQAAPTSACSQTLIAQPEKHPDDGQQSSHRSKAANFFKGSRPAGHCFPTTLTCSKLYTRSANGRSRTATARQRMTPRERTAGDRIDQAVEDIPLVPFACASMEKTSIAIAQASSSARGLPVLRSRQTMRRERCRNHRRCPEHYMTERTGSDGPGPRACARSTKR